MAVPALKFEPEDPVENRVTKLENNVEHILSDVSEIKVTMLRLDTKIDAVQTTLGGKIDSLRDVVSSLAVTVANQAAVMEKGFGELRGVIANQATTMEKGFGELRGAIANQATTMEKGFGELRNATTANQVWTLTIIGIVFSAAVGAVAWMLKNVRLQ